MSSRTFYHGDKRIKYNYCSVGKSALSVAMAYDIFYVALVGWVGI